VRPPLTLLLAWALVEAALFAGLCIAEQDAFLRMVRTDDSASYTALALSFTRGALAPSSRTPGYPLFLAACALLDGSFRLAIAMQLVANLGLALGSWYLVGRLVPRASPRLRAVAASVCFVAGLGLALQLMTDLLTAVYLFVALYGLLFWRHRAGVVASAVALGLATLTRPTFTLFPLLLPVLGWLASRIHTRVPARQLALLAGFSLAATALSIGYQYRTDGYLGPSSALTFNIQKTLHDALAPDEPFKLYKRRFEERLARRAQVPPEALSRTQAEQQAKRELIAALKAHPVPIAWHLTRTAIKYLFVPIEALPAHVMRYAGAGAAYERFVRPLLFLVCLPVWLLAYWPPPRSDRRARAYYALTMMSLAFVVIMSAMAPQQGERMRLPLVAFLVPLAVAQLERRRTRRAALTPERSEAAEYTSG
jgi:hypothetical protein